MSELRGKGAGMVVRESRELVNVKELAKRLGVKEGLVRQNMKLIPHLKMKRLVRFDPQAVVEHFKSGVI